ncbi:MAG: hypothetical protein QGH76_00580, partial [Phycisphaerales bacterium]|nr:hypothetical protein [Phycisphaerales bacterium]
MTVSAAIADVSKRLSEELSSLVVHDPVSHVYDPTAYAWRSHRAYLKFARRGTDALLLGMNPGPWGMVQTGVPFGEVAHVRDFLGINE